MKKFLFLCLIDFLLAESKNEMLEIIATNLIANDNNKTITASNNVVINKGNDVLTCDKAIVYLDSSKKPIKFEALDNVTFKLTTEDNRKLNGKSKKLIYFIDIKEYQLLQNAEIKKEGTPNFLKGERIIFNNKYGLANVESTNKQPARAIIDLNDLGEDKWLRLRALNF